MRNPPSAPETVPVALLTPEEENRLCQLAPHFDVSIGPLDSPMVRVSVLNLSNGQQECYELPREVAIRRALSEVCSRTVRWVYFNSKTPAWKSFFGYPDARLLRIAELYSRWKSQGCPA